MHIKKPLIIACLLLLWGAAGVSARSMYVNDIIRITFRTGPGVSHKVVDEIQSGQRVEVLGEEGGWTRVRLPDGKTGWVLSRFLTSERPNKIELSLLQEQNEKLTAQLATLQEENEALKKENEALSTAAAEKQEQLDEVNRSLETLKVDCADFITMRDAYDEAAADLEAQKTRAERLAEQVRGLRKERTIRWFLAGGGVLLLGMLLGMSIRRQRRRSYY